MFRQEGGVLQHWPAVLGAGEHGGLTRRSFSRVSRLRDPRGPGFSGIQVTFLGSDLQLCLRLFPLLPYALCAGGTSLRPPPPAGTSRGPCGWACGRRAPELRQPRKGGPVLHGGPCEQPQSGLRPRHPPVPAGRLLPFPCLLPPAAHSHHPPGLGARHLLREAFSGLPSPSARPCWGSPPRPVLCPTARSPEGPGRSRGLQWLCPEHRACCDVAAPRTRCTRRRGARAPQQAAVVPTSQARAWGPRS